MSRNIGFFVDVSNVYHCVKKKFPGRKISYSKLADYVAGLGSVKKAVAYGLDQGTQTLGFIHTLKKLNFEPKFKTTQHRLDWNVGITVDMLHMRDRFDTVVLASADGDLEPAIAYLMAEGLEVIILACGISHKLKNICTKNIEIPESMLEDEVNKTNV